MIASDSPRCAHLACSCAVAPGDAYCSEYCRKQVESPTSDQSGDCRCGHAECDTERAQAERMR
jgi:hypothetical protein